MLRLAWVFISVASLLCACGGGSATTDGNGGSAGDGGNGGGGSGGSGNGGSGNGGSTLDADELFSVCSAYGSAYAGTACAQNQLTENQIIAQCFAQGASIEKDCGKEFLAVYGCLAKGGFTCVNGYPVANSTCIKEQTDLQACSQLIPCKRFCEKATEAGCAPADCVNSCRQEQMDLATCGSDHYQLIYCQTQNFACENGKPSIKGCEEDVGSIGWCLELHEDACAGYCYAAGKLGCGDGCMADCTAKVMDQKCGSYYDNVIDCAVDLNELNLTCNGAAPAPTAQCESALMSYQMCMTM